MTAFTQSNKNRKEPFYMRPRNIVRLLVLVIGLIMIVIVGLKFNGPIKRILIFEWSRHIFLLDIATVEMYLADKRNEKSYKGFWDRLIVRTFMIAVSLYIIVLLSFGLKNLALDTFVSKVETKEVVVEQRWDTYRSYDKVIVNDLNGSYKVVPGGSDLQPGNEYVVQILPYSKFIIGISKI